MLSHVWLFVIHGLYSTPGFSVCGIFQARILDWVAFPSPGVFPTPGSNTCLLHLLHWQADSLPLSLPGKAKGLLLVLIIVHRESCLTLCLEYTKPWSGENPESIYSTWKERRYYEYVPFQNQITSSKPHAKIQFSLLDISNRIEKKEEMIKITGKTWERYK